MRIRELFYENADTTRKYEYSTKCRYNANTTRNYYAKILYGNTSCEYTGTIREMRIQCEYYANTMRNYYANTMKILCECDTFTSRCDDANIQANRLLRVYHAELLVRLDQFSYTLS